MLYLHQIIFFKYIVILSTGGGGGGHNIGKTGFYITSNGLKINSCMTESS